MEVFKKCVCFVMERNWLLWLIKLGFCGIFVALGFSLGFCVNYLYLVFAVVGFAFCFFMIGRKHGKSYKRQQKELIVDYTKDRGEAGKAYRDRKENKQEEKELEVKNE